MTLIIKSLINFRVLLYNIWFIEKNVLKNPKIMTKKLIKYELIYKKCNIKYYILWGKKDDKYKKNVDSVNY
jgi:hypothetical protein